MSVTMGADMETLSSNTAGSSGGDAAAVAELIADIEGELRLHQVRIQEFLEGTTEYPSVSEPGERARLLRLTQVLKEALDNLTDIAGAARA